jgi:hypothetical protein
VALTGSDVSHPSPKQNSTIRLNFSWMVNHDDYHWGKADDRNCNYGHPKMADMKLGKNLFCRLNC